MQHRLAARREPSRRQMRIQVGEKEHRLEVHQARIPHRRRAAEQWEHHPREERLQPEEKGGARERGYGEKS
jgi:hypothetical protein